MPPRTVVLPQGLLRIVHLLEERRNIMPSIQPEDESFRETGRHEEIDKPDTYQAINVETNAGTRYRIVIDVESDSPDELRLYRDNNSKPFLRLEL